MRMIFVNLPVKDLEATKRFYTGLGFELNAQFTSDQSAAVVIEENIVFMMLTHDHFGQFLKHGIADVSKDKEALICLSATDRTEVDSFLHKALASGGKEWMPAQDHGFMYGVSFQDPDGHVIEVMWMDPQAIAQGDHMQVEIA